MGVSLSGGDELRRALTAIGVRAQAATPLAVAEAATLFAHAVERQLTRRSHERGTPTPSRPGEPPAMVTPSTSRSLHNSLTVVGPIAAGPGEWLAVTGPTAAYARIQELGGVTGRGHATTLPPRPYMRAAYDEVAHDPALRGAFIRAWGAALT
ncbi:hypothetical protein [Kitasatospora sp. NPDC085464]|uniref:hypothetical protein n=1 Tax=Kitasatospora sp. NPDC085464 TaxID=3364063 RepID=UPI0037C70942